MKLLLKFAVSKDHLLIYTNFPAKTPTIYKILTNSVIEAKALFGYFFRNLNTGNNKTDSVLPSKFDS